MVNKYTLINPHVKGEFSSTVESNNSLQAAKNLYESLSEHFNNNIPEFFFTIQKGGAKNGKQYHFKISEKKEKNDVSYSIEQFTDMKEDRMDKLLNKVSELNTHKMEGGSGRRKRKSKKGKKGRKSKKDDDSSSSDSDSEYMDDLYYDSKIVPTYSQPLYYYYYDPYVYNMNSLYIPTFYSYTTPYIEVSLPI
jgi:hypothetical protein